MYHLSYYIGILIVIASHVYILMYGMGDISLSQHAYINLGAAALIANGWFGCTKMRSALSHDFSFNSCTGTQSRTCVGQAAGGADCSGLEGGNDSQVCNTAPCPKVDGVWSDWGDCTPTPVAPPPPATPVAPPPPPARPAGCPGDRSHGFTQGCCDNSDCGSGNCGRDILGNLSCQL